MASMALIVIALIAGVLAWKDGKKAPFVVTLVSALLVVFGMVMMRNQLRDYYLNGVLSPESVPVAIQWDLLIVFVIGAVALIGYLIWLVRFTYRAFNPPAEGSPS